MGVVGAVTTRDDAKRDRDRRFEAEALRWLPDVTRFALSLARDEADADDLVQETYLKAYQAWDSFRPGTECRAWLFTICRNTYYRRWRREERQVTCDDPELEALAAAAVHASALEGGYGDLFTRFDLSDAIDRAIAELPDAFRDVVLLVDVHDQPYQDAATALGVPVGTVRSRLFRARRLLQERLLEHARDTGIAAPSAPPASPASSDAQQETHT